MTLHELIERGGHSAETKAIAMQLRQSIAQRDAVAQQEAPADEVAAEQLIAVWRQWSAEVDRLTIELIRSVAA